MKTFLGFLSGLFAGIFAGMAWISWMMCEFEDVRDAVYKLAGGTINKTE
jgi:hypothetical protein